MKRCVVLVMTSFVLIATASAALALAGTWPWPVAGPVIRAFDPPTSPYGSGHRGIDIATVSGSVVRSPVNGTVSFSGRIGTGLFLAIDHGGGLKTTYSWVSSLLVRRGDEVVEGEPVALTGTGDPAGSTPNLHFGVIFKGVYVDPMPYLNRLDLTALIRLAPVGSI